jgi:CelD/BcsL family acetyltransferase involved in cellulose biosynthesis
MSVTSTDPAPAPVAAHDAAPPVAARVQWAHELSAPDLPVSVQEEATPDLFHTLAWFSHLYACGIERGDGLWIAKVMQSGDGAFLLPLQVSRGAKAAAFGPSLTSLSNYYSSLYGPVGNPAACTAAACHALASSLRRDAAHSAVIDLSPLDDAAPLLRYLRKGLAAEGYATDTYFCFGNWYLPVQGRPWSVIEAQIPSRQRNTVKRARKKLADAGPWTLQIHQAPGAALEQAVTDFQSIYLRSWKKPEPYADFVPGLCRMAAERGWLRLGVVRVADTPVAAQIWFLHQGKALIFKLAYDEEFKRLSAGSVLTTELMRHVIDVDHAVEVDYLTGDDAYKADWMSHRRERVGLLAFRRASVRGLAALLKHALGRLRARRRAQSAAATPAVATAAEVN